MLSAQEYLLPLLGRSNNSETAVFSRDNSAIKSSGEAVRLPFFDDFSFYTGCPDSRLWMGCDALVNTDYSNHPLSVGLVTLDAVDANGNLHAGANVGRFTGDTLCSLPIRLDSSFGSANRRLTPSDSVMMSFYYLPGGGMGNMWERIGSTPGEEDSLMLEFWNPSAQQWTMVWAVGGEFEDTLLARTGHSWQYVVIPVLDPEYLDSTFRFRFRNYCSLGSQADPGMLGNTDQWNIDYVRIDCTRSVMDECTRDIAFVQPAPSLLQNCWAIPARQFNPSSMVEQLSIRTNNLYGEQLSVHFMYNIFDDTGNLLLASDEGHDNIDPFRRDYTSYLWEPQISYVYPVDPLRNQYFDVQYILREGVNGDKYQQNDTLRLRQYISNYYAYDDGTPENGYGVTSTSSKVYLACKFNLNTTDTLTALDLYFNQTFDSSNSEISFRISIWNDENGKPGTCIYRDENYQRPVFDGLNRYHRYLLSHPQVVNGTIYIGLEQSSNKFISLGFDRNTDHHVDIYYLASDSWQQSVLSGSLMLRPCFGASALVDIDNPHIDIHSGLQVTLFPNPANNTFSITLPHESHAYSQHDWQVILYDMKGREVLRTNSLSHINISHLPAGLYLCRICCIHVPNLCYSSRLTIIR